MVRLWRTHQSRDRSQTWCTASIDDVYSAGGTIKNSDVIASSSLKSSVPNLSIWVGNDIQMKIIFHSLITFSRAIFHSYINKQSMYLRLWSSISYLYRDYMLPFFCGNVCFQIVFILFCFHFIHHLHLFLALPDQQFSTPIPLSIELSSPSDTQAKM